MLDGARTWHGRFIRQVRDKLSEQERAFREELEKGASAREGFRKVKRSLLQHTVLLKKPSSLSAVEPTHRIRFVWH